MTVSTTFEISGGRAAERLAVQLMIAQAFLFAAETAAIHQMGRHVSIMSLALIRAAGGLALVLVLARKTGFAILRTGQLLLQLLCGGLGLLYLWLMVYSFSHLNFADATAISYTHAAYIAVFSVFLLGETVTGWRWAGATFGFVGALLIAKPAFAGWDNAYLFVLAGTSLKGLGFVVYKRVPRDSELTTMFYANLVPFLANLPAIIIVESPSASVIAWTPAVLFIGPIGMYLGIVAVRNADVSMLGPYTFLRIVISVIGGAVVFHELPDIYSGIGTAMILGGCVLSCFPHGPQNRRGAHSRVHSSPRSAVG